MAPVRAASADISAKIVAPNPCIRALRYGVRPIAGEPIARPVWRSSYVCEWSGVPMQNSLPSGSRSVAQ